MFQTILQYVCFYIGLAHTIGVKGSIISGTNSFFAILIAVIIFKQERFSLKKITGCIIGFLGLVLISTNGSAIDMHFNLSGDGMVLLSAIASAFSTVLIRSFGKNADPVMLSGYQFLIGGAAMAVFSFISGGRLQPSSWTAIMLLIYMAMISAVAYTLWALLLKFNSVSRITVFGFMTPVFGVFLSALILKEYDMIDLTCLVSLLLVCLGIYIVNSVSEAQDPRR